MRRGEEGAELGGLDSNRQLKEVASEVCAFCSFNLSSPPLPSPPFSSSLPPSYSAGVGRSGTYIALDYCIDRLADTRAAANIIEVHGLVQMLRLQRPYMVQTEVSRSRH